MSDHFDAEAIKTKVLVRLYETAQDRPFDLLVFASDREDVVMGVKALEMTKAKHTAEIYKTADSFQTYLTKLNPAWELELIHLPFLNPVTTSRGRHDGFSSGASSPCPGS